MFGRRDENVSHFRNVSLSLTYFQLHFAIEYFNSFRSFYVFKVAHNAYKHWFNSFFFLQVFWAQETRQPRETMDFLIKSRPCAGRVKTLHSLGVTLYALLFLGLGQVPHVSTCWLFPIILKVTVGAIQPKVQCRGFNFWQLLSAC